MKKAFTIVVFALLALFYCFAVETALPVCDVVSNDSREATIEQCSLVPSPSAHLIHATARGRTVSPTASNTSFAFSRLFEVFGGGVEYTEQLFASTFSQYTFFSINLLIEKKKSKLIFPNHYFW